MNEKDFNKIEEMLSKESPNAGGPLPIDSKLGVDIIDFDNVSLGANSNRQDMIIHVKYFPEENRYGFSLYNKEGGKK